MGLETKFYIDANGDYLGGYSEGNLLIPSGSIEIAAPPPHGWQKRDMVNHVWLPLTPEQLAIIEGE